MTKQELVAICKERNEIDLLFQTTKIVAETDSIGEGYGYCQNYERIYFDEELDKFINPPLEDKYWGEYIFHAGLPIYRLYLIHLKIISE